MYLFTHNSYADTRIEENKRKGTNKTKVKKYQREPIKFPFIIECHSTFFIVPTSDRPQLKNYSLYFKTLGYSYHTFENYIFNLYVSRDLVGKLLTENILKEFLNPFFKNCEQKNKSFFEWSENVESKIESSIQDSEICQIWAKI